MTSTYAQYDASKPVGAQIARGADLLKRGIDELLYAKASVDAATDASAENAAAMVGGDFGALDNANATLLWEALYTIKYVIDGAISGGLNTALASINKGRSE